MQAPEDETQSAPKSFIHNDYFQSPEPPTFARPEEDVKNRIKELELTYGPFHAEISDELLALGKVYTEQQKFELAHDTLNRSLEVHRRNNGLHDAGQFPIVQQLILTNSALSDWKNVNKNYEYLYWLHKRIYDEDSLQMLNMLDALITWKINVINRRLYGDPEVLYTDIRNNVRKHNQILAKHPSSGRLEIDLRIYNNTIVKTYQQ